MEIRRLQRKCETNWLDIMMRYICGHFIIHLCLCSIYNFPPPLFLGGGKVNISDGQLGMSDFTIRIEITATAASLIQNKKKRMMSRASLAKNVNPMTQASGSGRNSMA